MTDRLATGSRSGVLIVICAMLGYGCGATDSRTTTLPEDGETAQELTRDEAIEEHWDEIQDHLNGADRVDACDLTNGGCYSLEAEISSGHIDTIRFPNGGWLQLSAAIDETGTASDVDFRGRLWEFTLDLYSPLIDEAVEEWAQEHGYLVRD